METTAHHDPTRPNEPELDLYTIPSYSSWFRWDDIHATERASLKEFFDGSTITRTPKIYKEYRDFIINKYRQNPSRKLTFTQIRKSLVADVSLLLKVFRFLEHWGLINFAANSCPDDRERGEEEEEEEVEEEEAAGKVRVEEGPPIGVRVVATPNSLKPMPAPPPIASVNAWAAAEVGGRLLQPPPLASYSDAFGELGKVREGFVCGSCGEDCDSNRYEHSKGDYTICVKCFKDGNFGENKSKDDFKLSNNTVWTEAETLLLLESVLRHGDDWELVAQSVPTKTKLDCIFKLIELPFGDLLLSSTHGRANSSRVNGIDANSSKGIPLPPSENPDAMKSEEQLHDENGDAEENEENEQNGDAAKEGPPLKIARIGSISDAGNSLMKQIVRISDMVGSDIRAAAAEAAVAALCDETSCPREVFDSDKDFLTNGALSSTHHSERERDYQHEDSEMNEMANKSDVDVTQPTQNDIPITLRLRATIGTALGAAAAHAKILADQEDQEIENLVGTIIETQLKKLQQKIKDFDDLELIMEKEYAELEELKESLTEERVDILQKAISSGISKWRDQRSHNGSML